MNQKMRSLSTSNGIINFPTYIPVTTFGNKYPMDELIRPYLPRLSQAIMVSFHYAKQIKEKPNLPLFIDSGGFVSLFETSRISTQKGLGIIKTEISGKKEILAPSEILELQEKKADVAFTLDFPIPPGLEPKEARKRQKLTIINSLWALANRRRRDLKLFAVVQGWDAKSAKDCAKEYKNAGFDGIAIGGLVPRSRNLDLVTEIVAAVKVETGDLPLHVFGLGKPEIVQKLFGLGVDSVDSSSYIKMAADGKLWGQEDLSLPLDISPSQRLHLALCNLANATGTAFPLSASRLMFSTRMIKK